MARAQGLTMGRGNRGLLLVAGLAGLAAAVLFVVATNQDEQGTSGSSGAGNVSTVVAAESIPAGTEITEGMVKTTEVPADFLIEGALSETAPIIGEVTTYAIAEGEQITSSKIGPPREGSVGGAADVLPPGTRGIGLAVDQPTSAGGLVLPGDRVDVIAVFPAGHPLAPEAGGAVPSVITILQNIEVLSVGEVRQEGRPASVEAGDTATSGQVPENVEEQPGAAIVTLIVDPAQAELLALYQEEAQRIYTVLRPFGEQG